MIKRGSLFLIILGGCTVGPNYEPPENTVCDTWVSEEETVSTDLPITEWWEQFEDPLLNKYIALAEECNQDILIATANIMQARALRQVVASALFPQIGADFNASKSYFSKNGPVFSFTPGGNTTGVVNTATGLPFVAQTPQIQNLFNLLFDASWEIDLFGKTRRAVEAADATIERVEDERDGVLITIMAEIARNYMELRSFQEKGKLIEENVEILEKKAQLVRKQWEVGLVSRLDDEMIQATLNEEKALLPEILSQIYRNIYSLSILTGSLPECLLEELLPIQALPKIPEAVAVGLRSDLLRRRPDIRAAERNLAAATANIGVAVASFFPTFTLFGDAGLQALSFGKLFSLGSRTWDYGGDIAMPIFQGGRLKGNYYASCAEMKAAAHIYQHTVITALEEAESAVVTYSRDLEALKERTEAEERYRELVFLAQERYKNGLVNLLDLLDREREYNGAEQAQLDSEITALLDLISLYKALGGGWETACLDPQS